MASMVKKGPKSATAEIHTLRESWILCFVSLLAFEPVGRQLSSAVLYQGIPPSSASLVAV
jgi:hypothetical protein